MNPNTPKTLKPLFLESVFDAKPGRVTVILLPNRMIEKNVLHLLDRVTIKVYLNYVKFRLENSIRVCLIHQPFCYKKNDEKS